MTGSLVLALAVLLALGFGLYRRASDGRARAVVDAPGLDAARLGQDLGSRATLVQFSASVCAPCRATRRLLGEVSTRTPGVAHVEVDAEHRSDLVDAFGVTRTPTVLVLDAGGRVHSRIVGAPTRPDVLGALDPLLEERPSV